MVIWIQRELFYWNIDMQLATVIDLSLFIVFFVSSEVRLAII